MTPHSVRLVLFCIFHITVSTRLHNLLLTRIHIEEVRTNKQLCCFDSFDYTFMSVNVMALSTFCIHDHIMEVILSK